MLALSTIYENTDVIFENITLNIKLVANYIENSSLQNKVKENKIEMSLLEIIEIV